MAASSGQPVGGFVLAHGALQIDQQLIHSIYLALLVG